MTPNLEAEQRIRRYLLGELGDGAREELEQELLTNGELFDELLMLEDELIDEYLGGRMSFAERQRFETHFLNTAERQEKLKFGRAFNRYLSSEGSVVSQQPSRSSSPSLGWTQAFFSSPFRFAAYAMLLVTVALGVWAFFFRQSDVDKGLLALNAAYRDERPIQARISGLNYAPFVVTRGAEPARVDPLARNRAEAILSYAVGESDTAAAHHALGEVYLAKKQFDDAIKEFEEALKRDATDPEVLNDLGAAWLEKGRISLEKGSPNPAGTNSGKGMEELGRSLEYLTKALELNPDLLSALFNRALCEQHLTLYAKAEEDWRHYLQKDPNSQWADEARRNLKALEELSNRAAQSAEQLKQEFLDAFNNKDNQKAWAALSRSRQRTGSLIVEDLLDNYLGLRKRRDPNMQEALQKIAFAGEVELNHSGDRYTATIASFYGRATSVQVETILTARQQMKLANAAFNKGEFDTAINLYSTARDSFARAGDVAERIFAENWIGYTLLRIPKLEESIQLFTTIGRELELRNYKSLLAISLTSTGEAQLSLNEFSNTLEHANRGLLAAEQIQDHASAVRCLAQIASTYLTLNNYQKSLGSHARALHLLGTIPPEPKLSWPLYNDAALNFYFLGLPATAVAFEQEALRLAELSGVPLLRSRSWERLGIIYSQQKDFDKAIKSGENALAEAQHISGALSQKNVSARSMLILGQLHLAAGNHKKSIEYFDQSLLLYQQLNFAAYAYQAHKGKFLAFNAMDENESAYNELKTVIHLFEEQRKKIAEESNRDRFFDAGQDTYDLAIDFSLSKRKDVAQAFEYAEASRARSLFEMMSSGARLIHDNTNLEIRLEAESVPLGLADIQKRMPENIQLLEYAVLNDKVVMWVVTRAFIRSSQTNISAKELDASIRNYVQMMAYGSGENRAILLESTRLYTSLIAPVEGFLDRRLPICIIADKSLNYLPFAALTSQSSGRYLIEDYELQQAPSASVFIRCSEVAAKRRSVANERILSVGNPRFDRREFASLQDLPSASREAKEVAAYYQPATTLLGAEASPERVLKALDNAQVIHLAMHAVADERSTLSSKLLFAADGESRARGGSNGVLQASDLYRLKFPHTRLVVLSACQTGIEFTYAGEGAIGLTRPFIAAGVPIVVASLWLVESEGTADLMISFHKHRKQNKLSTVAALRRAQLDFLHRQADSPKNYGWAAFVAVGGQAGF